MVATVRYITTLRLLQGSSTWILRGPQLSLSELLFCEPWSQHRSKCICSFMVYIQDSHTNIQRPVLRQRSLSLIPYFICRYLFRSLLVYFHIYSFVYLFYFFFLYVFLLSFVLSSVLFTFYLYWTRCGCNVFLSLSSIIVCKKYFHSHSIVMVNIPKPETILKSNL
jgi:hypothetical protein